MSDTREMLTLRNDAVKIADRANELLDFWGTAQVGRPSEEEISALYLAHYTSLEAIVSMLQTADGGLRLSDTSTMNDPEEGSATVEGRMILHLLETEFGKKSWLWQRYSAANVCCFVGISSEGGQSIDAGDDLLFWRLYGNDCGGVSLTIPPHVSRELVVGSIVDRVVYTDVASLEIDFGTLLPLLNDLIDLRSRTLEAGHWDNICIDVLPAFDALFKQSFLRKRLRYEMEKEYRSVAFLSENDHIEGRYVHRGQHVQYGRVRYYVQIPELSCERIFTTGSKVTIGSNVTEPDRAREALVGLINKSATAANVVSVRISNIRYRSR